MMRELEGNQIVDRVDYNEHTDYVSKPLLLTIAQIQSLMRGELLVLHSAYIDAYENWVIGISSDANDYFTRQANAYAELNPNEAIK